MQTRFDVTLMVKVAQMYYEDGLKQEEIAKELQISRSLISMILTEAKEAGIVQINIRNPQLNDDELSAEFEKSFGLRKCVIVPTAVQDANTLRKLVAQRTVDIFNQEIKSQSNVGVSWGRSCYEFISNYTPENVLKDIGVVPLIGASNQTAYYYQVNEMTRIFAEKINGTPYFIHAPSINPSMEEKELFLNSASIKSILEKWNNMDVIIAGIGALPDFNNIERETYIGESEAYQYIGKSEAVGDVCARYFNIKGEFIKDEYFDRILGIPLEKLRNAKTTIGIAAGMEKVTPILGALRTNVFDIFVTDEYTAKAVLKESRLK